MGNLKFQGCVVSVGWWWRGSGGAIIYLSFKGYASILTDVLKVSDYPANILPGKQEGSKFNYSKIECYHKLLIKVILIVWYCREFSL